MRGKRLFWPAILVGKLLYAQMPANPGNPGSPINTRYDEFAPTLSADGSIMVFNSSRSGGKYVDLYISFRGQDSSWTEPRPLHEINSPYNDETPFISADGKYLLFSSDRDGSREMPKDAYGKIRVSYDLYIAFRKGNTFTNAQRLPDNINTTNHEKSPTLSNDGKLLFYNSWPFGDITKSKIKMIAWQEGPEALAENLPSQVNSGHQDVTLTPAGDGKGYFFSSTRPGGKGGWDIYYVTYENGVWGNVISLDDSVNTKSNEVYLQKNGEHYFFCSNREGGLGGYDIYIKPFRRSESGTIKIVDKKTGLPIANADLTITIGKQTHTYKSNTQGIVSMPLTGSKTEMSLQGSAKGYLPSLVDEHPEQFSTGTYILPLTPADKSASFQVKAIYFDFNSWKIKAESYPALQAVLKYLQSTPNVRFEVVGHTDLKGSKSFNLALSQKRAEAVKKYLTDKGIARNRLTTRGAGKSRPVIRKIGPGYDEQNRRTEFILID